MGFALLRRCALVLARWWWMAGRRGPCLQAPMLRVGLRFSRWASASMMRLQTVDCPAALLDARKDVWARADRIAWGESPAGDFAAVPEAAHLLAARGPVRAPDQLVHGDLSGNVLFADGLPPAVIDFSPYWRPKGFASAIVAVDAVVWQGADIGLLSTVVDDRDDAEYLIRALIFRLLAERDPAALAGAYRRAIEAVSRLARS